MGGTLVCTIAAIAISTIMPKIFRIETLIRPGILSFSEDGKSIYIDTPDNIKALIEAGIFDVRILSDLGKSYGSDVPGGLRFKVTLSKGSDILIINYETSQIEQGTETLELLIKLLTKKYSSDVNFFQNQINKNLNIARAEIQINRYRKRSNENIINNIEKRIHELETGIVFVKENNGYLNKKRNRLLSMDKDESNILTALLYSNTIQQNLQLENDYRTEIINLKLEKEIELQNINQLENEIQILIAEIENLEFQRNSIQNIQIIQKPYSSPYPIKPNKKLNVILATFIGIFLMVFLSFIIEYSSKNIKKRTFSSGTGQKPVPQRIDG